MGDPRARLLDGAAWEQAKPTVLASLNLPAEAGEHLAARAARLDGTYRDVAGRVPANSQIVFDDGQLHLAVLAPEPEPASMAAGVSGMPSSVTVAPAPLRPGRLHCPASCQFARMASVLVSGAAAQHDRWVTAAAREPRRSYAPARAVRRPAPPHHRGARRAPAPGRAGHRTAGPARSRLPRVLVLLAPPTPGPRGGGVPGSGA